MSSYVLSARALVVLGAAAVGCMALPTASFAQSSAETACFVGPAKMSDAEVQSFLTTPAALLTQFSSGGLPMSTRVRSLAGSDSATLDPILGLVATANPAQVAAIGAGLARVAKACAATSPEYAATISEKVALLGNPALETAFNASAAEVQTAALGAGAPAGAGGGTVGAIGGGGTAGGGGNGASGGTAASGNSSGSFSTGGGGSVSTTTTTNSVSPSTL